MLSAYNENGDTKESYTYGSDRLGFFNGEEDYYYYIGTGSVSGLTTSTGDVAQSYSYDAFGNPISINELTNLNQ